MSMEYHNFFNHNELSELKSFVRENENGLFYTDHHTKYGIDLLSSYRKTGGNRIILGQGFPLNEVNQGAFIIYNSNVIDELKLQGHQYPDFSILGGDEFEEVNRFGEFFIYQKN